MASISAVRVSVSESPVSAVRAVSGRSVAVSERAGAVSVSAVRVRGHHVSVAVGGGVGAVRCVAGVAESSAIA